jgi:hypothetical protein
VLVLCLGNVMGRFLFSDASESNEKLIYNASHLCIDLCIRSLYPKTGVC